ncbi:MAG: hypothetical protein IJV74_06870 [Clostridia bacterium]|nr:hypothetical protein [Clostridia bacterium]
MRVFAIDPGNTESAFCVIDADTLRPLVFDKVPNEQLREYIIDFRFDEEDRAAVEMLQSYGMAIGRDVLETAVWIGRFAERLDRKLLHPAALVYRKDEKLHICHDSRAKDANIRRALIDRFAQHDLKNGRGTKKAPDWFYGFRADIWAAYAVGLTYIETRLKADG